MREGTERDVRPNREVGMNWRTAETQADGGGSAQEEDKREGVGHTAQRSEAEDHNGCEKRNMQRRKEGRRRTRQTGT